LEVDDVDPVELERQKQRKLQEQKEKQKKLEEEKKRAEREEKERLKKLEEEKKQREKEAREKQKKLEEERKRAEREERERQKKLEEEKKQHEKVALEKQKKLEAEQREQQRKLEAEKLAARRAIEAERREQKKKLEAEMREQSRKLEEMTRRQLQFDWAGHQQGEVEKKQNTGQAHDYEEEKRIKERETIIAEGKKIQEDVERLIKRIQSLEGSTITIERGKRARKEGEEKKEREEREEKVIEGWEVLESDWAASQGTWYENKEREEKREVQPVMFKLLDDLDPKETAEKKERDLFPLRTRKLISVLPVNSGISMGQSSFSYIIDEHGCVYTWGFNGTGFFFSITPHF
jgi:hypothetical protein